MSCGGAAWAALSQVGEAYVAEVERIVRLYLASKDDLEPVPAQEIATRLERTVARLEGLALVTSCDYHETMNEIRIAELKSRLSEYLRKVRSGRTLTVLDRDTPIARIVPYSEAGAALTVRAPPRGTPKLQRVPLPSPLRLKRDAVELLLEERQGER